jgi:hypothetical protein
MLVLGIISIYEERRKERMELKERRGSEGKWKYEGRRGRERSGKERGKER